jgi:hypothetical protein
MYGTEFVRGYHYFMGAWWSMTCETLVSKSLYIVLISSTHSLESCKYTVLRNTKQIKPGKHTENKEILLPN